MRSAFGKVIFCIGWIIGLAGGFWSLGLHGSFFIDWLGWFWGAILGLLLIEFMPLVPIYLWGKLGVFPWLFLYAWGLGFAGSLITWIGYKIIKEPEKETASTNKTNRAA